MSLSTSELKVWLIPVNMFITDRSKAVLLLWIIFVIYCSCLSVLCRPVYSLQPSVYLQGKYWPFGSLMCDIFLCFITFPHGDQVWSIPDICLLCSGE